MLLQAQQYKIRILLQELILADSARRQSRRGLTCSPFATKTSPQATSYSFPYQLKPKRAQLLSFPSSQCSSLRTLATYVGCPSSRPAMTAPRGRSGSLSWPVRSSGTQVYTAGDTCSKRTSKVAVHICPTHQRWLRLLSWCESETRSYSERPGFSLLSANSAKNYFSPSSEPIFRKVPPTDCVEIKLRLLYFSFCFSEILQSTWRKLPSNAPSLWSFIQIQSLYQLCRPL